MNRVKFTIASNKKNEPETVLKKNFNTVLKDVSKIQMSVEECKALCKKAKIEYLDGYENNVIQFVLTDDTIDRYNEIVLPEGGDLKRYIENPVVLGFHDSRSLPIGASLKTWFDQESNSIKGKILFLDERVDATGVSSTILKMVKSGILKTGSIGFIPKKARPANQDEIDKYKYKGTNTLYIHEQWELIEFSIVPIPANPSARAEDVSKEIELLGESLSENEILCIKNLYTVSTPSNTTIVNNSNVKNGEGNENNTELDIKKSNTIDLKKVSEYDISIDIDRYKDYTTCKDMINFNVTVKAEGTKEEVEDIVNIFKNAAGEGTNINIIYDLTEAKSGAAISKKNKEKINKAMASCGEATNVLKELVDEIEEDDSSVPPILNTPEEEKNFSDSEKEALKAMDEFINTLSDYVNKTLKGE